MATVPQRMTAVDKSNLAPIFLNKRLEGSSEAIRGLDKALLRFQDSNSEGEDIHENNGVTNLELFISHVKISLEASNASVCCN